MGKKSFIGLAFGKRGKGGWEWFEIGAANPKDAKEKVRKYYSYWDWEITIYVEKGKVIQLIEQMEDYPEDVKEFLFSHIGFYENKLALSRRIFPNWRKMLEKKHVIHLDGYVWFVDNLEELIQDCLKRMNRKKPYPTTDEYGGDFRHPRSVGSLFELLKNGEIKQIERGGKREGAGRKKIGITKKVSLTLPEKTWDQLEEECKASNAKLSTILREMIENAIE